MLSTLSLFEAQLPKLVELWYLSSSGQLDAEGSNNLGVANSHPETIHAWTDGRVYDWLKMNRSIIDEVKPTNDGKWKKTRHESMDGGTEGWGRNGTIYHTSRCYATPCLDMTWHHMTWHDLSSLGLCNKIRTRKQNASWTLAETAPKCKRYLDTGKIPEKVMGLRVLCINNQTNC